MKWYVALLILATLSAVGLIVADLTNRTHPARTSVPVEPNSEVQPVPDNNTPIGAEGGPYR